MKLEFTLCPNCLSAGWEIVANPAPHCYKISGHFAVVRCTSCRLVYLNPRPDQNSLHECYCLLEEDDETPDLADRNNENVTFVRRLWRKLN